MPRAAAASETHVAQAATEALRRATAVDAVVTAVLVAAAAAPEVLLGPVQLLAGGTGTGLVALDGRVLQPGRGAPRPRGFRADDPIPDAAYVGSPALPAALAVALGSLGTIALPRAIAPALEWAKASAPERTDVLAAIARGGGVGLAQDAVAVELLAVGGRSVGGLLTIDDLRSARPALERGKPSSARVEIFEVPWATAESPAESSLQIVAAADDRGRVAVAAYERSTGAIPVPALGLAAPRYATPVLRGKTRIAPGTPRPAAAPLGLRVSGGFVEAAAGIARAQDERAAVRALLASLEESIALGDALLTVPAGIPVVLAGLRGAPRATRRG